MYNGMIARVLEPQHKSFLSKNALGLRPVMMGADYAGQVVD